MAMSEFNSDAIDKVTGARSNLARRRVMARGAGQRANPPMPEPIVARSRTGKQIPEKKKEKREPDDSRT